MPGKHEWPGDLEAHGRESGLGDEAASLCALGQVALPLWPQCDPEICGEIHCVGVECWEPSPTDRCGV